MPRQPNVRSKRKGVDGAAKGANYERAICRRLSLFITDMAADDVVWRSDRSGGGSTQARKGGKRRDNVAGDIMAQGPEGHNFLRLFTVECKNQKRGAYKWQGILQGNARNPWRLFWAQAVEQCALKRQPLLLAKETHVGEWLITTGTGIEILRGGLRNPETFEEKVPCVLTVPELYDLPTAHFFSLTSVFTELNGKAMIRNARKKGYGHFLRRRKRERL